MGWSVLAGKSCAFISCWMWDPLLTQLQKLTCVLWTPLVSTMIKLTALVSSWLLGQGPPLWPSEMVCPICDISMHSKYSLFHFSTQWNGIWTWLNTWWQTESSPYSNIDDHHSHTSIAHQDNCQPQCQEWNQGVSQAAFQIVPIVQTESD